VGAQAVSMTPTEWHDCYVSPLILLGQGDAPLGALAEGFDGFVLDGILATKDIDGEHQTDWDCVLAIKELIETAMEVRDAYVRYEKWIESV